MRLIRAHEIRLKWVAVRDSTPVILTTDERLALLAAIVDSSDDAIISKDLDGTITSWNKSAGRLFGYTSEEVIGQPITILIPPDRLHEEATILDRLRKGERVDHFETIRRRKDGTLFEISLTISPVRDGKGTIVGASKIARDITESKKAMAELQRSNAILEEFAYSASHDLQEPLRTVKIFGEILMRRHADRLDPDGLSVLGQLQRGAKRMETLLNDLLAYTRVTKFEKPRERVDANLAYESALQNLGSSISESNAKVTADSLPLVADALRTSATVISKPHRERDKVSPPRDSANRDHQGETRCLRMAFFCGGQRNRDSTGVHATHFWSLQASPQSGGVFRQRFGSGNLSANCRTIWRPHLG